MPRHPERDGAEDENELSPRQVRCWPWGHSHEGVALTQFLSRPQTVCGTLGGTRRAAAICNSFFYFFNFFKKISPHPLLSGGGSCLRARRDGSHSPICPPSRAEHFAGLAASAAAPSRGWGCSPGEEVRGCEFVPWERARGAEGQHIGAQLCGKIRVAARNLCPPPPTRGGTPPRLPGLGSRIRANPVLRRKVMGGKEAIIKQTPWRSPTAHGFGTINRREGTKIAPPRVAVWTEGEEAGLFRGRGVALPTHPASPESRVS